MKLTAVYLEPQNGYKTPLRSDTLWGMLCWAIRSVYDETTLVKFIADYNKGEGTVSLSSCFPYIEIYDEKECYKTHYFPLPQLYRDNPLQAENFDDCVREMTIRKDIKKKLKYVKQELFEQILKGEKLPDDETLGKLPKPPAPASLPVTRNTINRIKGGTLERDGKGQLFHVDEYHLTNQTGLFFLVKGDINPLLRGALNYLSHTGFGGDRTVGKGWFKVHYDENFELNEPADANACTTLSLYHPDNDENNEEVKYFEQDKFKEILNYTLELRGGRLGFFNYKQVRKDAILMFKEGSVFPIKNNTTQYGKNPIVLEPTADNNLQHRVSHYGIGFMVKMNVESTK